MRICSLIFTLLITCSGMVSADIFSCVPDSATGFLYNKSDNSWKPAHFDIEGKKYLISPYKGKPYWQKNPIYEVIAPGRVDPVAFCYSDFNAHGGLTCEIDNFSFFSFNKINGRYLLSEARGYVYQGIKIPFRKAEVGEYQDLLKSRRKKMQKDRDEEMPYMEIGKCSPY